jgi:hypothetical protein
MYKYELLQKEGQWSQFNEQIFTEHLLRSKCTAYRKDKNE